MAACSASGDDGADDGESAPPASTGISTECLPNSSTVRRNTPAGDENVSLVDANVLDPEGCVDVVVFEFRSDGRQQLPPGYSVEYEDGPFRDFTSGDEFEPAGEAYLVLRFAKTSVFTTPATPEDEPEPTYTGRESIDPSGMNHLQEVRIVQASEEDEGMIVWVVGLDARRPYNIDASTLPLPIPTDTTTTTTTTTPEAGPTSSSSTTTSTTTTTTPPTTTTSPTESTSKIVLRIG
jgi:hypothetical protein